MNAAQIVITDDQAKLLGAAADVTLRANEAEEFILLEEHEKTSLQELAVFMAMVAQHPGSFPITGRMAKSVKTRLRQLRGPAQPASARNKRKARQEKRQGFAKRRRKQRRELAEQYNQARQIMEQEMEEARQIQEERQAQLEAEPKFNITDIMGNVLVANVPASMVVPVPGPDDEAAEAARIAYGEAHPAQPGDPDHVAPIGTHVVMPGSAEALETLTEHAQKG